MSGGRFAALALVALVIVTLAGFWLRIASLDALPPGISSDEATNLIDSAWLAQTGRAALYEDGGRPEPLFQFYGALTSLFFGNTVWAFRFTSALWGLLALPAVYFASCQCFAEQSQSLRRLCGLLALIVAATALGHICISRSLYRAVPLTFFLALAVGFCLRALREGRRKDYLMTAAFIACAIYSYTTGLVLPMAALPLAATLAVFQRRAWRRWLPGLMLLGIALLLLTAPVAFLLLTNPEAILARAQSVAAGSGVDWSRSLTAMVAQFFTRGDENPQYNVADAPLIDPAIAPLFCLGFVYLVMRFWRPSAVLPLSLLLLNSVPTLLSNEITHGLRIYAEFAVIPLIAAAGLIPLYHLLRISLRAERAAGYALLIATLAVFAHLTAKSKAVYDEFWRTEASQGRVWRVHDQALSSSEWFFRSDRLVLANWIIEQRAPMLIPVEELDGSPMRAYLMSRFPRVETASAAAGFADDTLVVLPWSLERGDFISGSPHFALLDGAVISLLPPFSDDFMDALQRKRADARQLENPGSNIPVVAEFFPLAGDMRPRFQPGSRTGDLIARFNDELELRQWHGPATISGAGEFAFTLDWSLSRPVSHNYGAFLQLLTPGWEKLAGQDRFLHRWLYPTIAWQTEDRVPTAFRIELGEALPPGAYRLVAGAWHVHGGLVRAGIDAVHAADHLLTIGWIKSPQWSQPRIPADAKPVDALFAESFRLSHVEARRTDSQSLSLISYWIAPIDRVDIDATLFLHAVDENGAIVAQSDKQPWDGQYPTFIWDSGETVAVEQRLDVGQAAGIQLYTGMYTQGNFVRLAARHSGARAPDDSVYLGPLSALLGEG